MRDPTWYQHLETRTEGKWDITPLLYEAERLQHLIHALAWPFRDCDIDKVAAPEALGFIFGAPVAMVLGAGFVALRGKGRLPTVDAHKAGIEFRDYSGEQKGLEVNEGAFQPGERVLIVDDWVETGAAALASLRLIEGMGAEVVGFSCLNADCSPGTQELRARVRLHALRETSTGSARL